MAAKERHKGMATVRTLDSINLIVGDNLLSKAMNSPNKLHFQASTALLVLPEVEHGLVDIINVLAMGAIVWNKTAIAIRNAYWGAKHKTSPTIPTTGLGGDSGTTMSGYIGDVSPGQGAKAVYDREDARRVMNFEKVSKEGLGAWRMYATPTDWTFDG